MPIYFVVYVQKADAIGRPYYQILKSIPAEFDDVSRLFDREVGPLQQFPQQYGGYVNYWAIYREPENPFQLQIRIAELEEEVRQLLENDTTDFGPSGPTAYTTGR